MNQEQDLAITVSAKDQASAKLRSIDGEVKNVTKSGQELSDKVKKAGVAIAAVGVGLTAYSKMATSSVVDYTKSVGQISRQTGMAVDDTSRLLFAFQHFGISAGQVSTTLGIFSKQIVNANDKSSDMAKKQAELQQKIDETRNKIAITTTEIKKHGDANGSLGLKIQGLNLDLKNYQDALNNAGSPLAALHVATKNADGSSRNFRDILLDVSDKFQKMPNGAEKSALAMQLFGRSGKDLLPVLNLGRQGIEDLGREADRLGLTLTSKNIVVVKNYIAAQKQLKADQQALTMQVGLEAIPMWQRLTTTTNTAVRALLNAPAPIHQVTTSVLAFGGPVAAATGSMIGFGANLGQLTSSFPKLTAAIMGAGRSFGVWGLVIAAAAVATIGIVSLINRHRNAQREDELATGGLSKAIELQGRTIVDATKMAHDALYSQEGATLDVAQAQRDYNQAVANFGPNSLEALQAAHNLTGAKDRLKEADDRAASAQQNLVNWENMIPFNTAVVSQAIDIRAGKFNNLNNIVVNTTGNVRGLDAAILSVSNTGPALNAINNKVLGISSNVIQVQRSIDVASQKAVNFQFPTGGQLQGTHRASGGPVEAGRAYIVGETQPELFVPSQSGTIYPDINSPADRARGGFTVEMVNNIFNQVDLNRVLRDLAWRLQRA